MQQSHKILVGILCFNALSAIGGSIGLVTGTLVLPPALLTHTPFVSYVIPGLILGLIVGASSLSAAIAIVTAVRQALLLSAGAGLIMMGWIVVEVLLIRGGSWLHGLYLATGFAVVLLASTQSRLAERKPSK